MKHYAFFSQTGSEIATIARRLGRWPDKIITNERPDRLRTISPKLAGIDIIYLSNKPTEKAYNLGLTVSGCVIHQVTVGVDEGPILEERMVEIKNLSLDEVYSELHKASIDLWVEFLK